MSARFPQVLTEAQELPTARAGVQQRKPVSLPPSPYADDYDVLLAQGRPRPAPAFGAPTLVWHVAVWPRRQMQDANGDAERCDPHDTGEEGLDKAIDAFASRRAAWLDEIHRLLGELRSRCARKGEAPLQLESAGIPDERDSALEAGLTPFTLWWGGPDAVTPDVDAIRICVHPEMNADYAAISFYMDIGQRWGEAHAATSNLSMSLRRQRLMDSVDDIRRICEAQLETAAAHGAAAVDLPALPELLNSPDQRTPGELHEALKAHRNLLYVDIWEAFSQEMSCRLEDIAGNRGEVFANSRGLVMSTSGLRVTALPYMPQGLESASVGTAPFARFSADQRFTADGVEPNAVVKAYWPLMRRITPRADLREHVACGVLDWRALYIADLGADVRADASLERLPSHADEGEASIRVPAHLLSDDEKLLAAVAGPFDSQVRKRPGPRSGNNHPTRYLLLTKHEPHPREIGQIAEQLNAIGTMRLFAFKDWLTISHADTRLDVLGKELDRLAWQWSGDRQLVARLADLKTLRRAAREVRRLKRALAGAVTEREVQVRVQAFETREQWSAEAVDRLRIGLPAYISRRPMPPALRAATFLRYVHNWRRYGEVMRSLEASRVGDIRHRVLHAIAHRLQVDLAELSVRIDALARRGIGGLRFRLDRATRHVRAFQTGLKGLRVGGIPTWLSYEDHAQRDLAPAFDRFRDVARRLHATRARLLSLNETIERSAHAGEPAVTRHAASLRRLSMSYAAVLLLLLVIAGSSATGRAVLTRIGEILLRLIAAIYALLPAPVTGWIEQASAWMQSLIP